jgi:predicted O-methyltransferase YrrM
MRHTHSLNDAVYDYLLEVSLREPPVLARLREETAGLPRAIRQIAPDQGQFMRLLAELLGVRHAIEVGTFTGYSALVVALALPADGRVITCDVNEETTAVARRYWAEAGVADRIELRLGPAVDTLDALLADGGAGTFDLAFVDADKTNYDAYYERGLALLRPGGLMLVDNVLWGGAVADPLHQDEDTDAIRALNAKIHGDERVSLALLPVSDGLTLARKR